jgi:hypothetical protein
MTWRMNVIQDEPAPPGWYEAESRKVENVDTPFGIRLRWPFWLSNIGAEAMGWTSMSPSTKARAYEWAEILNSGPIDPKDGWGPEAVEGKPCWAKVEHYRDSKGQIRAKVTEIKPIDENPEEEAGFSVITP